MHKCNHSVLWWKKTLLLSQAIFTYMHRPLMKSTLRMWLMDFPFGALDSCGFPAVRLKHISLNYFELFKLCGLPLHSFIAGILHFEAGNWQYSVEIWMTCCVQMQFAIYLFRIFVLPAVYFNTALFLFAWVF